MAIETAIIWVSSSPALWLATVALLFLFARLLRRQKLNLPPGPKHWPIVGNLNLIGPLPHLSIHELSKKYGPIMFLKFGSFPALVVSSAEMAKTILKTHGIIFASRHKTAAGKYTTYNYSDIIWSPYGPYWRQARRICALELFSAKRLDSFEYIRREELVGVLRELIHGDATNKKPIHLKDRLTDLGLNVISRMVMGKKYIEYSEDSIIAPNEFKEMLDELVLLNGVMNVGDFITWLAFLDLQGYVKRMKALAKKFDRFLEHVLDEHIKRRKGIADYVARDMVDVLLQLSEDPTLEVKLERHGVKAFCLDLIAGGTESSAVTVEYAMCELLRKPHIIKKAQEELDMVIGKDKWVEEKDTVNLPYINAIIKETMRLHPVSPILPRESREDCKIDGYDIPKGTRTLVSVFAIGRDPAIWEDPEEFYPERFIGKATDVKGHDYELLPFGGGRRMCPGYSLGLKVVQASLSNLLHGFNWEFPEGMKKEELDMEEICGLTTSKKTPLVVMAEPRLPLQVYSV